MLHFNQDKIFVYSLFIILRPICIIHSINDRYDAQHEPRATRLMHSYSKLIDLRDCVDAKRILWKLCFAFAIRT